MQHRPWKKTKFQSTTLIAVVVLLMMLFSLVGYFFVLPDVERSRQAEQLQADIVQQRERWKASKPAAYRYVVERECYCPDEVTEPYTVTVAGDVAADAAGLNVIGIDDLFRIAANAASASQQVDVLFDTRFGYPARVTIDDLEQTRASVEVYRVRDFEVIDYGRRDDTG